MTIAYLSCPYSDPDPKVRVRRHQIVNQVVFEMMQQGTLVYSPLTHNVPINELGIHGNWLTWKNFDHGMLSRCDRLIVLKLPGWENSKGVAAEVACAQKLNLPIEEMEFDENKYKPPSSKNPHQELIERMLAFYSERDWAQFHSPKNLAMNLVHHVGELMEHFRFLTEPQSFVESPQKLAEIGEEIGDIFLVLLHLAHSLGIDPIQAAHNKLFKTAQKYPVEKCKGQCQKYTEYL